MQIQLTLKTIFLGMILFHSIVAQGATDEERGGYQHKKPSIGIIRTDYDILKARGLTSAACRFQPSLNTTELVIVKDYMGTGWERVIIGLFPPESSTAITILLYVGSTTIEQSFFSIPDFMQIIVDGDTVKIVESSVEAFMPPLCHDNDCSCKQSKKDVS